MRKTFYCIHGLRFRSFSQRDRGERLRDIRTMRGALNAEIIIVLCCSRVCNIRIVVVVSVLLLVPKR